MEHTPTPPISPEATPPTPNAKRAAFFERWNKRVKRNAPEAQQPSPEANTQRAPEAAPVAPERKSFGKNIVGLIFGERPRPEAAVQPAPQSPEASQVVPPTPEQTPQYDRATRMRRLARVILANVLGQVNQEPVLARQHGEAQPLNTQPLAEAAQNLQAAANMLGTTIDQAGTAQTAPAAPNTSGNYDPQPQQERPVPTIEHVAAERIDRRLRRLEAVAEENRAASVAVAGLGVLAVLLTGAEYFGRKREGRKIRRETREQFAAQENVITQQRAEFDELKREQVSGMDRIQRRNYYERLSSFTSQQAERTREADRELQEVVIARTPEVVGAAPVQEGDVYERRQRQARQPERATATPLSREQERELDREPQPLVRVESVERTEHQPGQQTGSAGTGFFGGGGGGIASGTGPSDLNPPRKVVDPNSPEARKLEELRKAEQARLQQNAWFYGAALIVTLGALLIITIVLG